MKKIISMLLFACMMLTMLVPAAMATPDPLPTGTYILLSDTIEGDQYKVTFSIGNNPGIWSYQGRLYFNEEALRLDSQTGGTVYPSAAFTGGVLTSPSGFLFSNDALMTNVTGDGDIITYNFTVIDATKDFNLGYTFEADNDIFSIGSEADMYPATSVNPEIVFDFDNRHEDETTAPDTSAPETTAPDTSAPETSAPETSAPETSAPDTTAPLPPLPSNPYILLTDTLEGDQYKVTFSIGNNPGIWSYQGRIYFNEEALRLDSQANGTIYPSASFTGGALTSPSGFFFEYDDTTNDTVIDNITGDGVIITYNFTVLDATKSFGISYTFENDNDIYCADVSGENATALNPEIVMILNDMPVPETAPDTSAPVTSAPDTSAPVTSAPDTSAPETSAPDTSAPETSAPETSGSMPPLSSDPYILLTDTLEGDQYKVTFSIGNNPGIWSYQGRIYFNEEALRLDSQANGTIYPSASFTGGALTSPSGFFFEYDDTTNDTVIDNITGDGVIITYNFTVLDATKSFGISYTFENDNDIYCADVTGENPTALNPRIIINLDDMFVPETAPDTSAPETTAPDTSAPETSAPETSAPETSAPETSAPETSAPEPPVTGDMTITLTDDEDTANSKYTVTLSLSGNTGVAAYSGRLLYNSDALTLVAQNNGDVFADSEFTSGYLTSLSGFCFMVDGIENNTNNGTLITYQFTVNDKYANFNIVYSFTENDDMAAINPDYTILTVNPTIVNLIDRIPETSAPETSAPDTSAPDTSAPETSAPETSAPETTARAKNMLILKDRFVKVDNKYFITLDLDGNTGLGDLGISINFNPNALKPVSQNNGIVFQLDEFMPGRIELGKIINLGFKTTAGLNNMNSGNLVTLEFDVLDPNADFGISLETEKAAAYENGILKDVAMNLSSELTYAPETTAAATTAAATTAAGGSGTSNKTGDNMMIIVMIIVCTVACAAVIFIKKKVDEK